MHNTREKPSIVHGESGSRSLASVCIAFAHRMRVHSDRISDASVYIRKISPAFRLSSCVLPGKLETTAPSSDCLLRACRCRWFAAVERISRERVVISSAQRRSRWSQAASGILRADVHCLYILESAISHGVEKHLTDRFLLIRSLQLTIK